MEFDAMKKMEQQPDYGLNPTLPILQEKINRYSPTKRELDDAVEEIYTDEHNPERR